MAGFRVNRFGGEIPIRQGRKMSDGAARSAVDCDLVAHDLRCFRASAHVGNISGGLFNRSAFVYNADQMFVFSDDIDATFGPIQHESETKAKVYISSGFQGYPVWSNKDIGFPGASSTYHGPPIAWRKLGIPPPPTNPLVDTDGIQNGTITQVVARDNVSGYEGTYVFEATMGGAVSGLETGDKISISGLASPEWDNLNGNVFKIKNTAILGPDKFVLEGATPEEGVHYGAGSVPSGSGTWTREFSPDEVEDRLYVYTLVSEDGEEGPPSGPSALVQTADNAPVTVTTATSPQVEDAIIAFKRIYRTIPTSRGTADFYFVAEIPVTQAAYEDTLSVIQLGEKILSTDWFPPPEDLKGLLTMPNGIMVGFSGRELWMCAPYQPHAWPAANKRTLDYDIVAIAAFAQSLIVITDDKPYVGSGADPLSMTLVKLDSVEPCLSKRACKDTGGGVLYPSPNGLILARPGGATNVTKDLWDEKDWRAMFGSQDAFAAVHDGRYYLMFESGTGVVFDPKSRSLEISRITIPNTYGAAVDRDEDRLFLLRSQVFGGVYEWNPDGGSNYTQAVWKSQTFVMPVPVNMGAMQVFYDTGAGGSLTIEVYADGVLKHTKAVTNQEPSRLPSGFMAREWHIVVRSTLSGEGVQAVYIAETIDELEGAMVS